MNRARYAELLRRLAANEVEFIVVGMMAGHDPRRLRPAESHLMSPGHQLLATTYGDLDCLGTVGDGLSYEDLLGRAPELKLGDGRVARVIDLPTLIELKERAGRPKDLAAVIGPPGAAASGGPVRLSVRWPRRVRP